VLMQDGEQQERVRGAISSSRPFVFLPGAPVDGRLRAPPSRYRLQETAIQREVRAVHVLQEGGWACGVQRSNCKAVARYSAGSCLAGIRPTNADGY